MARKTWNEAAFRARTALSTLIGRPVVLERAPTGSQEWKEGKLLVKDAESGDVLATVHPIGFRDPKTGWDLRTDC